MKTLWGDTLYRVYIDCLIFVQEYDNIVSPLVLSMTGYDLSMVLIGWNHVILWLIAMLNLYALIFLENHLLCGKSWFFDSRKDVLYVKACQIINRWFLGFIVTVHDTQVKNLITNSVPIVQELLKCFQKITLATSDEETWCNTQKFLV